jgi:hypothetical protein
MKAYGYAFICFGFLPYKNLSLSKFGMAVINNDEGNDGSSER